MRISKEALFHGSWPKLSTHVLEKYSKIRTSSSVPPMTMDRHPKSSFGRGKIYAPQTKILEGLTKEEIRIFEGLFKGVRTRFGLRTIEKCFENPDFFFCQSFQIIRLGWVKSRNFFVRHTVALP